MIYRGGGTSADTALEPPENENAYPEPSMFGTTPAYGLFIRHAKNIVLRDIELKTMKPDARPAIVTKDALDIRSENVKTYSPTK